MDLIIYRINSSDSFTKNILDNEKG